MMQRNLLDAAINGFEAKKYLLTYWTPEKRALEFGTHYV